jgi:hypothetical protein
MKINKDELKESLTIEQVWNFVADLGGNPKPIKDNCFISQTICHNKIGEGSYKLYYYDNTKLFKCFTSCLSTFDLFDLVKKQKTISDNIEWSLPMAIAYVASYFGYTERDFDFQREEISLEDWNYINSYDKNNHIKLQDQIVELKVYNENILNNLPHPRILEWEQEGINPEIIKHRGIAYDPVNEGIVIPHYDIDGQLIGIRERTLIKENEQWGKYLPAKLNGTLYRHPLSFNLYNLNNSKDNIKVIRKAIIFESEKSTMLYASYFGEGNDITVACCGQTIINHQLKLLSDCGAEEIVIAFDKEGEKDDKAQYVQKFYNYQKKYGASYNLSFIYDKDGKYLDYKMSPIDNGKQIFLKLFKERIFL